MGRQRTSVAFWGVIVAMVIIVLVAVDCAQRRAAYLERQGVDDRMNAQGRYLRAAP